MATLNYFAYGSNMLSQRLMARCPSATVLGVARVPNFRLSFSKLSVDGSGKATLVSTPNSSGTVHGVVFRIPLAERGDLDAAEGLGKGYNRLDSFTVICPEIGSRLVTTMYIADECSRDEKLIPYDWYRDLALAGALQNGLPQMWITMLRGIPTRPDPYPDRPTRREALRVLQQAGYDGLRTGEGRLE